MVVIKRNGTEVPFDKQKIISAITRANKEVKEIDKINDLMIAKIADDVEIDCERKMRSIEVEEIQELVETNIMRNGAFELAKRYIRYRHERAMTRTKNTTDETIMSLLQGTNEELNEENSNKNTMIVSTQRDYIAGETSKDLTRRYYLPPDIVKAHDDAIIHFHDMDYFAQEALYNCCLINLEDMLQNDTAISQTLIESPHTFSTAATIATQIIAQVASCQYGGQSISIAHLAPFVNESRKKFTKAYAYLLEWMPGDEYKKFVEELVKEDISRGVQTIQYQVVTLMTTNGQAPFITVFLDINEVPEGPLQDDLAMVIEEVLKQRYQGVKNEQGVWVTPAFPKLIYAVDENNIEPDSKYYYLTRLAAKCTAKRFVPDYISSKKMRELKKGDTYPCMGCRSFLTPDRFTDNGVGNIAKAKNYKEGVHKYYGRFNQGVVTLNLVDIALSSGKDEDLFWKIFDERLDLCHRALRIRHEKLLGTPSDVAPILWQKGAIARLEKGEKIDPLLYNGYSTISLGYAGLYECTLYMTGASHTDEKGKGFALAVMQHLNDACNKWKTEENIDYSVYGTPLETSTYRFAKGLQKRFGIIPGITDKNYVTNSYHVVVTEPIDAFTKLKFESQFQELSPGGAISYIECPNMQNNIDAVMTVIKYIYNNIMYAELNIKSDYCQVCGYDGEIEIVEDEDGKLIWRCPSCGCTDQSKMNVARRTCGYIGTQYWNQGRTQEIRDRVLHL